MFFDSVPDTMILNGRMINANNIALRHHTIRFNANQLDLMIPSWVGNSQKGECRGNNDKEQTKRKKKKKKNESLEMSMKREASSGSDI